MSTETMTVRLELESHPENVALVRSALTGLGEAVDLDPEAVSDLKTALSEACNNVALHAYEDSSGPMVVEIHSSAAGIAVAVIDRGSGITHVSGGEDRMGLGLALISALASSSEFRHVEGGGTEVRMWFARRPDRDLAAELDATTRRVEPPQVDRIDSEILASFAPPQIMRPILRRMVQALAASSHFSIPKLSDLAAANEAIAGYIETAANTHVEVAIAPSPRRLAMRTGPLPGGDPASAEEALAAVVDELHADREKLLITLVDSSR